MDIATPIDFFSKTVTMIRKNPGSYDSSGNFVEGSEVARGSIAASIQPVTGQDLIDAPEGIRTEAEYKLWTRIDLKIDDEIVDGSDHFRVCHARPRRIFGAFNRVLMGKLRRPISDMLEEVGKKMRDDIQNEINTLSSPPNAPATIKKKGFDNPLIETREMVEAIDYEVTT